MKSEIKELYTHTKNRFEKDLQKISPACIRSNNCSTKNCKRCD